MCVARLIDGRISIPEQLLRGGCRTDRTASDDAKGTEKEATGTSKGRLRDGTFPIADLEPQSIDDHDHSERKAGRHYRSPPRYAKGTRGAEIHSQTRDSTGISREVVSSLLEGRMMPQPGSALHPEDRSARIPTTRRGGAGPGENSSLNPTRQPARETIERANLLGRAGAWPRPLLWKIYRGAV